METTVLLAVFGGVLCGAAGVGSLAIGFLWWQSYRRTEILRSNLGPAVPAQSQSAAQATPPPPPLYNKQYADYQSPNVSPSAPSVPSPVPAALAQAGIGPGSVWLDGIGGMVAGQRITIYKDETLLGRSGVCDVQFHDLKVSRQHALLRRYNGQYYLYDMQSSGGTFVNEQKVESQQLRDRDQIRLGDSVVIFRRS
ncbi:MAG: hypothetical protein BroJett018_00060 [Chloroflexota bacterium]|nr:FHA domain-containing protein [Chloroflexota bacterium]NOG63352.1 FHA domain-containing protein [Chloroflexota bacterium]GIK62212.1 MAG: hypothetical protein BroJett018_00060 [Chloroflexota bacterium]